MDSKQQNIETTQTEQQNQDNTVVTVVSPPLPSSFATLSLSTSLSLTTILNPNTFFQQPKISKLFNPNNLKIPTQASSLTHFSLSASPSLSLSKKLSFNSTISSSPLQIPLSLGPQRPCDPSSIAALRKASIVWFRNDLRVHDNECLNSANAESMSVLPVYCFDPRDYGKSSSGFDKTGPSRAKFIVESVSDLRRSLQARGSDLVVRVGRPECVLVELAKEVGAGAVYAHHEVSKDEVEGEGRIGSVMKEEDVEVKFFWGSTLYHVDDLPCPTVPPGVGGVDRLRGNDHLGGGGVWRRGDDRGQQCSDNLGGAVLGHAGLSGSGASLDGGWSSGGGWWYTGGWGDKSGRLGGSVGGDGGYGRGCRSGSLVVALITGADGHGDGSVVRARLHSVGIVGGVAVSLLLWCAGRSAGGNLPVAVPWVAVDLAQVVPDGAVVVEGVLVLHNVGLEVGSPGELDGPAVAVGELSVDLAVDTLRLKDLIDVLVATVGRGDVAQLDRVGTLVDDDGTANRLGGGRGREGCGCDDEALHFEWKVVYCGSR